MLVIQKGKCAVKHTAEQVRVVENVEYNGHKVYICEDVLKIGKYMAVFTVVDGGVIAFGEIKLTTGDIAGSCFVGNYVLCEY